MAEHNTAVGDGLDVNLVSFGNDTGTRSLIGISQIGYDDRMVGLTNIQALNLAAELINLASANDDTEVA